jgi:hypothetical protein
VHVSSKPGFHAFQQFVIGLGLIARALWLNQRLGLEINCSCCTDWPGGSLSHLSLASY